MTVTVPATEKNLDAACASVANEIARTDSKASLLLAFNGAVLAGLASVADKDLPAAPKAIGALAVVALGTAAALLLLVVKPRLRSHDRASFPYWATLDEDQIRVGMEADTRAATIRVLSILAVRKYRHLRRAVDLSLTALVLLALAAAGTAL
ncbi:Pycsar system effector family protein [Streptomyces syringium]|uniref:Pycsar system effector family protein n=1 Tax=Streptomyces syringium TaxID=76729 RepID=UPI0034275A6F